MSTNPGTWIAALLTLGLLSYLYKDNIFFEFAEHTFVGISAAHAFVQGIASIRGSAVASVKNGQYIWLVPIALGLLLYARYLPRNLSWLSRFPVSIMVSIAAAAQIRGAIHAEFVNQIIATMKLDLRKPDNAVFFAAVVSVCMYFLFLRRVRESAPVRVVSKLGRCFLMVAFGTSLGTTVMGRYSLLIGRLQFLFGEWIKLIK